MVKTNKNIKYTRKVILIKFKDGKETLIVSKTFKRNEEKLTMKVNCNTKINNRLIDTESKEKYPLHQLQLKERIVPCCCREKCFKKQNIKKPIIKEKYNRDLKNEKTLRRRERSLSPIISNEINNNSIYENISSDDFSSSTDDRSLSPIISNELNKSIYENISSDDFSSSTDDEIESLITSTRRRMKDSDDDWNLLQKRTSSLVSKEKEKMYSSINSLDTLILEVDNTKHSDLYDLHNDGYSPTVNPETKSKYEYLETNNNNTKFNHDFMDEKTI